MVLLLLLQVLNRRAGPLEMSGIRGRVQSSPRVQDVSVSEVCVCVPSSPCCCCLYFSDTGSGEPMTGTHHTLHTWALPTPSNEWHAAGAPRRGPAAPEDRQAPGTSCQARCFSIFRSPLFPISSFVCPGCRCASPWALPACYRLLLVPSQTSQNTSYHLIRLLLGPLRPFQVFDDCQILPRSCSYKSFWPCLISLLFLPLFLRKTKPPNDRPTDRPTDDRRGPDLPCRTMR